MFKIFYSSHYKSWKSQFGFNIPCLVKHKIWKYIVKSLFKGMIEAKKQKFEWLISNQMAYVQPCQKTELYPNIYSYITELFLVKLLKFALYQ